MEKITRTIFPSFYGSETEPDDTGIECKSANFTNQDTNNERRRPTDDPESSSRHGVH